MALVTPAMAVTTTATSLPASSSTFTRAAARRMRGRSATEVPPNFITMRAIDVSRFVVIGSCCDWLLTAAHRCGCRPSPARLQRLPGKRRLSILLAMPRRKTPRRRRAAPGAPPRTAARAAGNDGNPRMETMGQATAGRAASIDDAEVAKFAAMAEAWWDPEGKFRPLHRFNPVRLAYIRDRLCEIGRAHV